MASPASQIWKKNTDVALQVDGEELKAQLHPYLYALFESTMTEDRKRQLESPYFHGLFESTMTDDRKS
jgi:hypothetical protein